MLMTKPFVLTEKDLANYTVDLLEDDGARRGPTFIAKKVRLRPGLSVAFEVCLVARAGGPAPVLSLAERWTPEQPERLAGKSLRKYLQTRAKAIREARDFGNKLGAVHPVLFQYTEPPAAWLQSTKQ